MSETPQAEQWMLYINGYEQGWISVYVINGEAHMSVREYCAYADYAAPIADIANKRISISTVKVPDATPGAVEEAAG